MTKTVYYITGMGGRLDKGLGRGLLDKGFNVKGRELYGVFRKYDFQLQTELIAKDLTNLFWDEECVVIANSFGAYLFLNAQAQMKPYIGKVILLSPIVGEFSNEETLTTFVPPFAGRILELAKAGKFPTPKNCEIYCGELDWQSNPKNVSALADMLGVKLNVVPKAGHMLPKEYVEKLLDNI
jgi:pimeloyl-ACP methyl ester carboxylesterase